MGRYYITNDLFGTNMYVLDHPATYRKFQDKKGKVLTDKEVKEIIIFNSKIGRETNIWLKPRRRYPVSDTTKRAEKIIYERIMNCDE